MCKYVFNLQKKKSSFVKSLKQTPNQTSKFLSHEIKFFSVDQWKPSPAPLSDKLRGIKTRQHWWASHLSVRRHHICDWYEFTSLKSTRAGDSKVWQLLAEGWMKVVVCLNSPLHFTQWSRNVTFTINNLVFYADIVWGDAAIEILLV